MLETGLSDAKISSQRSYDTLRGRPVYSDMTEFLLVNNSTGDALTHMHSFNLRLSRINILPFGKKIETHHRGGET